MSDQNLPFDDSGLKTGMLQLSLLHTKKELMHSFHGERCLNARLFST
jgi:hypothetical protein